MGCADKRKTQANCLPLQASIGAPPHAFRYSRNTHGVYNPRSFRGFAAQLSKLA
jgi:hypothetical protein